MKLIDLPIAIALVGASAHSLYAQTIEGTHVTDVSVGESTYGDYYCHSSDSWVYSGYADGISEQSNWWTDYYPPALFPSGVTLERVHMDGSLMITGSGQFTGLNPGGTHMEFTNPYAGASGRIGQVPLFPPCNGPFTDVTATPIQQGETRDCNWHYCAASWNEVYTPGHPDWAQISQSGNVEVLAAASSVGGLARDSSGILTPVQCEDIAAGAIVSFHYEQTYALHRQAATHYCSSAVNATGEHGRIEVYGTLERSEPSEFSIVRAANLPDGSFAVLFGGTAPTQIPGATTTTCVAGSVFRMGGVQRSELGVADFEAELGYYSSGDTAYFQCFHRDPVYGVAATNGYSVQVQ